MTRRVFNTMGTTVSLCVLDGDMPFETIADLFAAADARFSLYLADSELSLVASGARRLDGSSEELLDAYTAAIGWRNATDGAFNPNRPDGVIDLNGIVKAETMHKAGAALDAAGCANWSLVVGGDLLASGRAADGSPWQTGIVDPRDRAALICSVPLLGSRRAIATSGSAERGDHIWRGGAQAVAEFSQVTVVADDIVTADVLATAIIAGGRVTLDDVTDRWPVDVLAITPDHALSANPGFSALLAAPRRRSLRGAVDRVTQRVPRQGLEP